MEDLDITEITNRIYVIGGIWKQKTQKESHKNNLDQLKRFLITKKHLLINLHTLDPSYNLPHITLNIKFNLDNILNMCKSVAAWLAFDGNVVVFHCVNGLYKSALAVCCFLKFAGICDSALNALEFFIERRKCDDQWINTALRRYLIYFDTILESKGQLPNTKSLGIHQIILNTVPNYDGNGNCDPILEILGQGQLKFCSLQEENSITLKDQHHIIFSIDDLNLEKDVQIKISHLGSNAKSVTMLNIYFNSGFIETGLVRFSRDDIEIPMYESNKIQRFDPLFSVDVVLSEHQTKVKKYSISNNSTKNIIQLSKLHYIKPDPTALLALEMQGNTNLLARIALQMTGNDIHAAHEFLFKYSGTELFEMVDSQISSAMSTPFRSFRDKQDSVETVSLSDLEDSLKSAEITPSSSLRNSLRNISRKPENVFKTLLSKSMNQNPIENPKQETLRTSSNHDHEAVQIAGGPPPPPPPPPPTQIENKKVLTTALRLEEISNSRQAVNTIWQENYSFNGIDLDIQKFEQLFCIDPKAIPKAAPSKKSTNYVLDIRRNNNVAIALSKFRKRFTNEQIVDLILERSELLSLEDLQALIPLFPTDEEIKSLQAATKKLTVAEEFMYTVSKIPHIKQMTESLLFQHQFDTQTNLAKTQLKSLLQIFTRLQTNKPLKELLRMILDVGNLVANQYSRRASRGPALGFTMSSLMKLVDVKSVDRSMNLVDYLVIVAKDRDDLLQLPEVFSDLEEYAHFDFTFLTQNIRKLNQGVDKLKKVNELKDRDTISNTHMKMITSFYEKERLFASRALNEMKECNKVLSSVEVEWKSVQEYFGESREAKPQTLFSNLNEFFKAFKRAIESNK